MAVQWSVAWAKMELFVFWNVLFCADSVVYWGGTLCERWKAKIPVMGNRVAFAGVQVLRTWILVAIGELFFGQRGFGRESGCSAL